MGLPVSRREQKLDSLGLKLNLALLVLFLVIGAATAAFVFIGFNRTRDNATDRSQEALEQQGKLILQDVANAQADLGSLQMEWAAEIGHRAAQYMAEFKATGGSAPYDVSRLTRAENGIWQDVHPDRRADLIVLPRDTLDEAVLDDIAYSSALEALFPALLSRFPGEIRGDSFHPIAIIFVATSGMGRYYPPRGVVYETTPPDIDLVDVFDDTDPEHNPDRNTVWTAPYQDRAGQGLVITALTPVYEGDRFRGLFEVDLLIGNLADTVNEIKPTESGFAFYVDVDGNLLRTNAFDLLTNELDSKDNEVLAGVVGRMQAGERGIERVRMGGAEFFIAYAPMIAVGGGFAVASPISELTAEAAAITAEIDQQADQTMLYVLVSMTALFGIALLGASYLNRRVLVRPIEALAQGTRAVAQGDFGNRIPVSGGDELAALGRSFNQMTADIQREVHEREAAQEELKALFAAMSDMVFTVNSQGRFLAVAETNSPMKNTMPHGSVGQTLYDVMPEAVVDTILASIGTALRERRTVTIEFERRANDRSEWHLAAISPLSDDSIVAVVRDITERVAARQELERQVAERTHELTSLLTVSRNIASNLALKPLVQTIIDQVKNIADYSRCSLFVLDGDGLVMLDSKTSDSSQSPIMRVALADIEGIWERVGAGQVAIEGDVRNSGSPIAVAYQRGSRDLFETAYKDIHSWMGVPLETNDRVIGMLTVSHNDPNFYTERHAGLVTAVATQVAVAIENARLYEQAQQLAAVEERQRLARELHDSVSQALYGIALGARTARTLLDREPGKAAEPVDYVLSLAEAGLVEMRALIFELRPESLEIEGLMAALDKQIGATAARYGIQVTADLTEEPEMDLAQKEIFYRIGQEALHNVVKHAHATKATVRFAADNGSYVLEVGDDGIGFDTSQSFPGHMGLVSMSERASSIGAELEVESRPGQGTVIKLRSASRS
ncbi:MAG TPA: histidine kinase [Dehalococcoidia bacterium]|nr:histidine kinase [Dehalococcoidia bacterium]